MILVTAATGTTGGAVLDALLARGVAVRGLTRSPDHAEQLRARGAEAAVGDLSDPASLARAFARVERVYLAVTANEHQVEQERNAIAVAEQSGAYAVVKLGIIGQSPEAPLRFARNHAAVFQTLRATSLRWTLLQPNGFMQNVLGSAEAIRHGRYASALGDAEVSLVDARDVAAVAVRALTEEGHEGASYTLTGPEALSDPQIAEELGVAHVQVSDEEMAATLREAGVPEWKVAGLTELAELYRSGAAASVAPDVEAILGRPARSFASFAAEHRDTFAPS